VKCHYSLKDKCRFKGGKWPYKARGLRRLMISQLECIAQGVTYCTRMETLNDSAVKAKDWISDIEKLHGKWLRFDQNFAFDITIR
jgi:hypothetical protein